MSTPKSRLLANARYIEKAYDSLAVRVKKGKRDYYKQEAAKRGLSLASLIQKSVEEYLHNHQPS